MEIVGAFFPLLLFTVAALLNVQAQRRKLYYERKHLSKMLMLARGRRR